MTDVRLYQTPDGGEISVANGVAELEDGLQSAAYLSLFGGNEEDSGGDEGEEKEWWGNTLERDPARALRSRFQHAVQASPLLPTNLPTFEDAARADLEWMVGTLADAVDATASLPAINTLTLSVGIVVEGNRYPFDFVQSR